MGGQPPFHRALVIGCAVAGKTTFSRRLAAATSLPLVPLDREFWQPGWEPMPRQQWRDRLARLVAEPQWIMDGNFDSSLDIRLPRADALFWFDFPRHVCIRRVLLRVATHYGTVRPDMAPGCRERLDLAFLRWIWTFNARERPALLDAVAAYGRHLSPVVFRHDSQVEAFMTQIAS